MARKKKKPDDGGPGGAPEWMVTFSDCMTLLLTFFVLLLSFSSFDEKLFRDTIVVISKEFAINKRDKKDKGAFLPTDIIKYDKEYYKGSEKPTLIKGKESNTIKEENETEDFHDRKIFLIPSNSIFMGRGNILSAQGKKVLSEMAPFIKEIPNRIVISENSQRTVEGNKRSGLERAWTVTEYFTADQGLSKQQFSISAASTVTNYGANRSAKEPDRMLEIVFLERSIYN
jgi:chemotaxis protein MotB